MTAGLTLSGLSVGYGRRPVLDGVDVADVPAGTMLGLLGPNASGKSTLLKALAGQVPYVGHARFGGAELAGLPAQQRSATVGYLPQTPPQATGLLAYEVALSAFRVAAPGVTRAEAERRIAETFELLGLDQAALSRVDTLSGGKRQLLGLSLVLARRTPLLVLDEPTSALDLRWQIEALAAVHTLVQAHGAVALVAIHDLNLALRFCDRVAVLGEGRMLADGPANATMTSDLLRRAYSVHARVERCSRGYPQIIVDSPAHDAVQTN
jgi:iron complex transport system ATP-binding protein